MGNLVHCLQEMLPPINFHSSTAVWRENEIRCAVGSWAEFWLREYVRKAVAWFRGPEAERI